jgi:hypothetical protein
MAVKLSVTSKLDGIKSWSLQALDTCPGSVSNKHELVDACQGCYATTGNYVFANVKAPREFNRTDWQRDDWVSDMVKALGNERYFRWLDSGDLYDVRLARKVYAVMRDTPWVQHWLPTRMHKFAKFLPVLDAMRALPNVAVRFSSDSVNGGFTPGVHGSTIITAREAAPAGVKVCEAYEHGGKCSGCRACWDRSVPVIAYVAHGRKMQKVVRIRAV